MASLLLAACSSSQPEQKDTAAQPVAEAQVIYDSINQPLAKAKDAERQIQDAADRQKAQIDKQ